MTLLLRRALLVLVLSLGLIPPLASVASASADDLQVGQSAVVTGTEGRGLRVRSGPGMSHRIVTTLNEGTILQIVAGPVSDSDGSDDWYQISSGRSTTGWSPGRYLVSTVSTHDTDDGQRTFVAKVTAYSDGVDGIPVNARTASGTRTRYGVVAVDPKFISVGSSLSIEGYDGVFVAEDIGGGLKGPAIDIWLPDPSEARRYGTQSRRVTVLREGPPK